MKKIAIFGAGEYGRKALKEIGEENVISFIDNNSEKWGSEIGGITVFSGGVHDFKTAFPNSNILVAVKQFDEICSELELQEIDYEVYFPRQVFYGDKERLLVNPYENRKLQLTESDVDKHINEEIVQQLKSHTKALMRQIPMFNHIEIETYNRCNGGCEFCPVSVKNDKRKECFMEEKLFYKIINELSEIGYDGCIALFSNNEPFLDERIINFCRYTHDMLPYSKTHLYTNATVLSLEKFVDVIDLLDEIIIDNYNSSLKLIKNVNDIYEYCKGNVLLEQKVTIVLRNPKELLESRGGYSPNREANDLCKELRCTHPFRQMIIRPDGKVSLCCNDALGITNMGDVNKQSLYDVWYNDKFFNVRKKLYDYGRGAIDFCKYCDSVRLV